MCEIKDRKFSFQYGQAGFYQVDHVADNYKLEENTNAAARKEITFSPRKTKTNQNTISRSSKVNKVGLFQIGADTW